MYYVLVQSISTRWTKMSRGSPGSAKRNSIPQMFDVPCWPPDRSSALPCRWDETTAVRDDGARGEVLLFNHHLAHEEPMFERFEEAVIRELGRPVKICDCWLTLQEKKVVVQLDSKVVAVVAKDTWSRVVYNRAERIVKERSAERKDGTWADWRETEYHKKVLNIGCFQRWESSVFKTSQPVKTCRRMRELRYV